MTIFISTVGVTPQDIKNAGFFSEMFGQMDATAFDSFIEGAINAQAAKLAARIGSSLYASTDQPTAGYVLQALMYLVQAEMWRRRIARKLGQAQGTEITCKYEIESRDLALEEAESWIFRLVGGDFASGLAESSHFDGQLDA